MNITVTITPPVVYYRGLSDIECNDPLGDGTPESIYTDKPYTARNVDRVAQGAIPEVRQFRNGDTLYITEPVEWLWFSGWKTQPSLDKEKYWERFMRSNAAFTNLGGIDECRSWVLNRNTTKKAMKYNGVDCPGGNLYRATGSPDETVNGIAWAAVWVLDYDWISGLSVANAKALTLPRWLLHNARTVYPTGIVTNWDYDFTVPAFTGEGKTAMIDGYHCRENWVRRARVRLE